MNKNRSLRPRGKRKPTGSKVQQRKEREFLLTPLNTLELSQTIQEARQSLRSVIETRVLDEKGLIGDGEVEQNFPNATTPGESQKGNLGPYIKAWKAVGAYLFEDPEIRAGLRLLQWEAQQDNVYPNAKKHWRKIAQAFGWLGGGAPVQQTEEQREQAKRANDMLAQQTHRAVWYCDRMWRVYTKKTIGITDAAILRAIASRIAGEELNRGAEAKREGVEQFCKKVQQQLGLTLSVKIPS